MDLAVIPVLLAVRGPDVADDEAEDEAPLVGACLGTDDYMPFCL